MLGRALHTTQHYCTFVDAQTTIFGEMSAIFESLMRTKAPYDVEQCLFVCMQRGAAWGSVALNSVGPFSIMQISESRSDATLASSVAVMMSLETLENHRIGPR